MYDGGITAPVTASNNGVVSGDVVAFSQSAVFTGTDAKNVDTGKPIAVSGIALSGADAANYALSSTTATASGNITKKPISIDGLTGATATDRVYDAHEPSTWWLPPAARSAPAAPTSWPATTSASICPAAASPPAP